MVWVGTRKETYRHSDPLYVPKVPTKSISILPLIYIINFLIQYPEIFIKTKFSRLKYILLISYLSEGCGLDIV